MSVLLDIMIGIASVLLATLLSYGIMVCFLANSVTMPLRIALA